MTVTTYDFLKPPSQPGDLGVLSHYRVIDELGRGGMGFVFRAEDMKLKRPVALKVMNQRIAATPHSRRRFIREARAMAAVHHDNVATIFEVGESNQTPFMAMEMLQGSTLEVFKQDHARLGFETVIDYARQISRGLAAAHQRGIVHRDIKPANIWIETDRDRIKILDFGLALASTPIDQLAGRGAVIGTPGYLSPEQARSEPLDDRSDLYSLGVVLYELCTGQLPLQSASVPGQLISILVHRPKPIQEWNPNIPQPLCDLIHRLLRKEPRDRLPSAIALLGQLDDVERQCHAKSEAAQAIDKLKASLSEVVKKQSDVTVLSKANIEAPVVEDLALLSEPLAIPTPAFTASSPKIPVQGMVGSPRTVPASSTHWQAYLPVAVIVAAVLIALPLLTFFFSGSGNRDLAVITETGPVPMSDFQAPVNDPPNTGNQSGSLSPSIQARANRPNRTNEPAGTGPAGTGRQGQNRNQANPSGGQASPGSASPSSTSPGSISTDGGSRRNPSQGQSPNAQTRNPNPQARDQNTQARNPNPQARNPNGQARNPNGQARNPSGQAQNPGQRNQTPKNPDRDRQNNLPNQANASRPNRTGDATSASSGVDSAGQAEPANPSVSSGPDMPAEAKRDEGNNGAIGERIATQWTTISTAEGRGADAMVQSGTGENFGSSPSIGIRRRGRVETNHSYLRFDLSSIEGVRKQAESAELLLSVVGDDRPVGTEIRVYAVADVGMWPEQQLEWKVSFSVRGLDELPLLAQETVTAEADSEGPRVIRIRSRELAEFIAASDQDSITVVLAGAGTANEMVRFVSRDATGADAEAPRLRVLTPTEAPTPKTSNATKPRR